MKKVIRLAGLDCANCAAKLERAIQEVEGIEEASLSFITQKLTVKIQDDSFPQVLEKVKATIVKVNPDVSIIG